MAAEILRTKWMAMTASIWIQCTGGGSYTFGIYSAILKSSQSYDQSTLDTVSVFKDIGGNVGVLSGLLYTAATFNRRRSDGREGRGGPWVVILVGAVLCFTGYFLIWASVTGLISKPPVPVMCLFMFIAAQSLTFLNTANVVSSVENFADYGGTAVGIMKGFVGLSGAMLIQLYEIICPGDPKSFILLLAIVPSLLSVLVMPLVRIYETSTVDEKRHLDGLSTLSLIIAAYLMIIITVKSTLGLPSWANTVTLAILLVLLASPLLIAVRAHRDNIEKPCYSPLVDNLEATTSGESLVVVDDKSLNLLQAMRNHTETISRNHVILLVDNLEATTSGESLVVVDDKSLNLLQAMRNVDFWLLFLAMVCGMGSGISTINNMRQIGESLRYSNVEINALLSLWNIWNFIGRFGAGYASDALLHKKGWPRPLLMATTL
ncbi:hypothetical protein Bca52824_031915 [Brassica carinata]|uniref:Nodulin-like domain-containing protein n=1 Tax=Brassica carinata TaxID=52824 RepID=A0A8X7SFV0_BRACI|nr:hypothetical protein Bca52824_031915 [Brassica carinata]